MILKALSIRQPWAYLIMMGIKPVENRTWKSPVRGRILIHAGKQFDQEGFYFIQDNFPEIKLPFRYDCGGFVGSVEITDCVEKHESPWFFGPYGFVMKDPIKSPLLKAPGQLGFFDCPNLLICPKCGEINVNIINCCLKEQ